MKRLLMAALAIIMVGTLLVACSSKDNNANKGESPAASNSPSATAEASASQQGEDGGAATYPLNTDKTLTYWGELTGNLVGVKATHDEVPFFQEWQKITGVKLNFIAPPSGQAKEALNILLASGDLPDIIEYNFLSDFPGGPEKAIAFSLKG